MANVQMGNKVIGIGVAAILVVGGGSFFGGMKYGEGKTSDSSPAGQFTARNGRVFNRNGNGRGGVASGSILSMDNQSITVKLQNGGSQTIYYSGSTKVGKVDQGTAADLKAGDQVLATGSANPDGSIAAQNIEIVPAGAAGPGGFMFRGGGGGPAGNDNGGGAAGGNNGGQSGGGA